jgi:predicted ArsR family transcriptional regulator
MKDTTRTKILKFLQSEQTSTPAEIARTLNVTAAAVRYHLARLENEGLIERRAAKTHFEPGRPAQVFRLSPQSQPNFMAGLASALLASHLKQSSPDSVDAFWANLAMQIADSDPESLQLPRRLSFSIRELNRMNYQARWEAGAQGPRILLFNCPYADIWPQFPGLCQMDLHLLERWTGRKLQQTARIDLFGRKHTACIFEGFPGLRISTLQLA